MRLRRLLLALSATGFTACPSDLDDALKQYNARLVYPAADFWQPGTLVAVAHRNPLKLEIICSAREVMGDDFRPTPSETLDADVARFTRRAVNVGGDYLELLRGDVDLHHVKTVKMSLRNARVTQVTDRDVYRRLDAIDPACLTLLWRRYLLGHDITMVAASFAADVVYTVQYDRASKLDAAGQVEVLQNLALKLGVEATALGGRSVAAKGLILGVRTDDSLLGLLDRAHMQDFAPRRGDVLGNERVVSLIEAPWGWPGPRRAPQILPPCAPGAVPTWAGPEEESDGRADAGASEAAPGQTDGGSDAESSGDDNVAYSPPWLPAPPAAIPLPRDPAPDETGAAQVEPASVPPASPPQRPTPRRPKPPSGPRRPGPARRNSTG